MFRVEIGKALRRWRTWLLAAALAGVPVLDRHRGEGVAAAAAERQDAPPFLLQIVRNGLFAPLTGLAVVQPFFMSLAIGLFAGDAIAGEAQSGTLRYLLVRPVRRVRLLGAKYLSSMALTGALLVGVILAGLLAGGVVFGFGPLPTLSGTTLSTSEALAPRRRVGRVHPGGRVGHHGRGAVHLDAHRFGPRGDRRDGDRRDREPGRRPDPEPRTCSIRTCPTHGWLGFTGLFRFPVDWSAMRAGLTVSVLYTAVFMVLAAWNFRRRDITS